MGKLQQALYGTRDAPQLWGEHCGETLKNLGFEESVVMPSVFVHKARGIELVIHVDDFLAAAEELQLDWLMEEISKVYENKAVILGPESHQKQSGTYLGRSIKWTDAGIEVEGNPKHAIELLTSLGMLNCRSVTTPLTQEDYKGPRSKATSVNIAEGLGDSGERPLPPGDARLYRKCAALAVYLAQDRPDLSAASCHLSKFMAVPTANAFAKLKRVARYLRGAPRCVVSFRWQDETESLTLVTDSDWADCRMTRKSHSGGAILLGDHLISHWCRIQPTIALSSGEAELYSGVYGLTRLLNVLNVARDLRGGAPGESSSTGWMQPLVRGS